MLSTKFRFIWACGFRETFSEINQSETRIACGSHVFFTDWDDISNLYSGPSIDASYEISINLPKRFQRNFFRNQPIRNKNCLWWQCLLTDRDEISNLYRKPSIDASYQVSVHLAKRFQRKFFFFRNRPIRNKNCLFFNGSG